jgi:hypothetical protein
VAERFMKQGAVIEMAVNYFPSFLRSRAEARMLGAWMNGKQYEYAESAELDETSPGYGRPFQPNRQETTREYENLRGLSPNAFAGLIVTTMSQMSYLEGISKPGVVGTLPVWETFQRNRWLSRQTAVHRGALGQAVAYGVVLPGADPLTGSKMSKMIGKSAEAMSAWYDDEDDEWPVIAMEAYERYENQGFGNMMVGWTVRIYDEYVTHRLVCEGDGATKEQWTYIDHERHGMPVPPVARCANRLDLDGRATGEIEPVLPLLRRIDQDVFDRLIVQRFGAWKVRYIAGMAKPDSKSEQAAQALKLRVEDLLVSTSNETKFGVLPAGNIENQIKATDADLRLLSAISQMPPHHLLGLSSNLQAEALAAATEGLQRKSFDFRTNAGEFHQQMARLVAMGEGDFVTAAAWDLRVRWKDTESGSMSQAADALGKLAVQLKVPLEMLWERIPGWTDTDVQRAKELAESGELEKILAALVEETTPEPTGQEEGGQEDTSGNAE